MIKRVRFINMTTDKIHLSISILHFYKTFFMNNILQKMETQAQNI